MSDQLYGHEEREQSMGYAPMPLANPLPKENWDEPASAPDPYQPLSPKQAAELLRDPANRPIHHEEPATEQPPTPVQYNHVSGERAGEQMPDNQVVSAEQAAHDLASYRE